MSDPAAPLFELFVGNAKFATLYDPRPEDMFWCSYRIAAASPEADAVLHDEATWNAAAFIVRAPDGRRPNDQTIAGSDFAHYCRGETDMVSFRSLWPPAR